MARDGGQLLEWPGVHREAKQMPPLVKMLWSQVGTDEEALEESQETSDKKQEEERQMASFPGQSSSFQSNSL